MATVKMIRGSRIADIFDSPETIAQAEKDGFVKYEEEKPVSQAKVEKAEDSAEKTETPKTSRTKRQ